MNAAAPIVSINNLTIDFVTEHQNTRAVNQLSVHIHASSTLAIVGESGSGKSVTALSLLGLLPSPPAKIVSGEILFTDKQGQRRDLLKLSSTDLEAIRGHDIGFIFQEPMTSLNPLMRCGEQVAEVIRRHKGVSQEDAKKQTLQWLEKVKLPNPELIYNKYPHEISGGQKQRVMIAMAISCHPSLLIADEPTTALDVTVQKNILDLLAELQASMGMAILFISHDLNVVKSIAEDIAVMYKSELVEYGPTTSIFAQPKHPYTMGLLSCRPKSDTRVKYLKTVSEMMAEQESGQVIPPIEIGRASFEQNLHTLQQAKPILEVKHIVVDYPLQRNFFGKVTKVNRAVNQLSFCIREKETLGLVGESGCGKSTIGKAIVQLAPLASGEILYKGKNINDFNRLEKKNFHREVQVIFQDPYSSLNPRMSIGEAIKETMDVYDLYSSSERRSKVEELLTKVDLLPEQYHRYPHEFSGGQRQRICIARTLALQPQFIICDESVSALDVSVQAQVLNLLTRLRDEFSLSYLFISHDLNVVKHISDHILVMKQGQLVEYNQAEELYHHPRQEYTKELLAGIY